MMNPIEAASVCVVGLAVLLGTLVALPRHKPGPGETPAPVEYVVVQSKELTTTVQVQQKADVERVKDVEREVEKIRDEQRQLIKELRAITAERKGK